MDAELPWIRTFPHGEVRLWEESNGKFRTRDAPSWMRCIENDFEDLDVAKSYFYTLCRPYEEPEKRGFQPDSSLVRPFPTNRFDRDDVI